MSISRAMMIHASIHWDDLQDTRLWPLAVKHAVFLYNHTPNVETGLSPRDLLTRTRWPQSRLRDLHVWGCPMYLLKERITGGSKLPRWKPKTDNAAYVGVSDRHASSVPLGLRLDTGAIVGAYHSVCDDWFATVTSTGLNLPDLASEKWTHPVQNWNLTLSQLAIHFDGRLENYLDL